MRKIQTLIFAKKVESSTSSTRAIIALEQGKTIKGQDYRNINQINTSNSVVDDARDNFEEFQISLEEMVEIIEGQGYNQIDK